MEKASISEAKNRLSALIDRVRNGATIVIEDRGVPVARLEPLSAPGRGAVDGRVARLVRQGVVRMPSGPVPRRILTSAPPTPKRGASLSQAVIDERRGGR